MADSGDAKFSVSLPVMGELFDDLVAFRRYLAEQIESFEHTVMALGSDWSGDARDAWRHLDSCWFLTFLHASPPRVACPACARCPRPWSGSTPRTTTTIVRTGPGVCGHRTAMRSLRPPPPI